MSHKFVAGAGLLVLAGWGISGLAVAGVVVISNRWI